MTLSVIGAGFGRTGTNSLRVALEQLGCGRCYHMFEVAENPRHVAQWRAAGAGAHPDWDALFAGYGAAVDWPTAYFWRELAAHYPRAKVVLTVRDPDSWWRSVNETIFRVMRDPPRDDPSRRERLEMARELILDRTFGGRSEDRAHVLGVFARHRDAVERAIAPERLLVYEVSEGWGPLCRFLGVAAPPEPFPLTNTTEEFRRRRPAGSE